MRHSSAAVILAITLLAIPGHGSEQASVESPTVDPTTGLLVAPGWELVKAHCGACHSYRLITAQRGDARYWTDTIRWMQRTQNLWEIPADTEGAIIEYLATAYDESEWGRRPSLPPQLMPDFSGL